MPVDCFFDRGSVPNNVIGVEWRIPIGRVKAYITNYILHTHILRAMSRVFQKSSRQTSNATESQIKIGNNNRE